MESVRISPQHATAAQELLELRAKAAALEAKLKSEGVPAPSAGAAAAQQMVAERWQAAVSAAPTTKEQLGAVTLNLSPEEHDEKMAELLGILETVGIEKAIVAAEATGNLHVADDFHRVLVEYVRGGHASAKENTTLGPALNMRLFEVVLPAQSDEEKPADATKALQESMGLMEQFYRGMLQMDAKKGEYFAFEIANPVGALHTTLYIAVPAARAELFEKQLLALYPKAKLIEQHNDYNAFADGGVTVAASAALAERPIYSLKTYESFTNDPLNGLLSAFSKLEEVGEGAALQFVVSPADFGLTRRFREALERVRAGYSLKEATNIKTGFARVAQEAGSFFSPPKKLKADERLTSEDPRLKNIERKIGSPILHADIRIVASAGSVERARAILEDIEAPLRQLADTAGNSFSFSEVSESKLKHFAHEFSYRQLHLERALPLTAAELATLAHLPSSTSKESAPELRQVSSVGAPAPVDLASDGTLIGVNKFRSAERKVFVLPEDRLRHFYLIGQTGTGKSALLKNMVLQDIKAGSGVCFIDPHGTDVLDILSAIPPERHKDVIYFDPAEVSRPMGLNMLEYDINRPEQKTLVVDELLGIFKKLFGAIPESMGPAFEQYFRNAALLVMEDPASGNTLLDIGRIFSDPAFRAQKLSVCKNPIVKAFWEGIAEQATGEQGLQNYGPYVTSKFDQFTTNDFVRPIIAQQTSAFNFREIMDNKKILLVNLAKGRIGELNANLLGLVIVGKFLIAALSRADSFGVDLPAFYLHIDEFQNFATPSIATILSEARKYKLSLTIAHQFIAQLTDEIKDAVFGNVGSLCVFRVGAEDAEFLSKQFAPVFSAAELMRVDNFNAFVRLLVRGKPALPFNIATLPFESGSKQSIDELRELSFSTYGKPREAVEAAVVQNKNAAEPPAALAQNGA